MLCPLFLSTLYRSCVEPVCHPGSLSDYWPFCWLCDKWTTVRNELCCGEPLTPGNACCHSTVWFVLYDRPRNLSAEINTESQYLLNHGCVTFLLMFTFWFILLPLIFVELNWLQKLSFWCAESCIFAYPCYLFTPIL